MKINRFRFLRIIRPVLWIYAISVALTMGVSAAAVYPAYVFREVYDQVLPSGNFSRLLYLMALLCVVYIGINILNTINSYATAYANSKSHNMLRLALMRIALTIPYRNLEQFGSGQLLGRFQSDLGNIAAWVSIAMGTVANSITTFISVGGFIYFLDYRLLTGILPAIPLYVLVNVAFKNILYNQAMTVQQCDAAVLHRLEDLFRGARDMALSFTTQTFEKWLDESQRKALSATLRMSLISSGSNSSANLLAAVGPLGMLTYGGYLVMKNQITMGTLIAFMAVVNRLFQSVHTLFALRMQQYALRASIMRVEELLGSAHESIELETFNKQPLTVTDYEITVDSVTVQYDQGTVLNNISFTIPPGSTCLVSGPNGAGKSTLMEVIAGLQTPASGKVLLGGRSLSEIPRELLRKSVAVVPQRPHIFDRTLLHNLTCSDELHEMYDIRKAMEVVGLSDGVSRFSSKDLDAAYGVTGRTPSGGEVHRVAMVRAILLRPKVLIFDEAFSSLPPNSEKEILDRLRKLNPDMTIIVVSHRPSPISNYSMTVKINLVGGVECHEISRSESKYNREIS